MRLRGDAWDEREGLRNPLLGSLGLHAGIVVAVLASSWMHTRGRTPFGEANSTGGGAYSVSPVASIPFPSKDGPINRLANDTPSQIPAPAKPEPRRAAKEDVEAIPLRSKKAPKEPRKAEPRTVARNEPRELAPNQLTVRGGQQANSPLFSPVPGSGGIGVGPNVPFGQRFGGYYAVVRDKVARFWRTDEVDPRVKTAPEVIVTFEILRDGRVRDFRIVQRSGVVTLDNSAQRAVLQAAPFPPLPPGYERDSAVVEFWFSLKR